MKLKLYVGRIPLPAPNGWWYEISPAGRPTVQTGDDAGLKAWGSRLPNQQTALARGQASLDEILAAELERQDP